MEPTEGFIETNLAHLCTLCGAWVGPDSREKHATWHKYLPVVMIETSLYKPKKCRVEVDGTVLYETDEVSVEPPVYVARRNCSLCGGPDAKTELGGVFYHASCAMIAGVRP